MKHTNFNKSIKKFAKELERRQRNKWVRSIISAIIIGICLGIIIS